MNNTPQFSRLEMAALKRLDKNLAPHRRKMNMLQTKIDALVAEYNKAKALFDRENDIILARTGGIPIEVILNGAPVMEGKPMGEIQEIEIPMVKAEQVNYVDEDSKPIELTETNMEVVPIIMQGPGFSAEEADPIGDENLDEKIPY